MTPLSRVAIVLILLMTSLLAACGDDKDDTRLSPAEDIEEITRQVIQEGEPTSATGQNLQLTRVIIPAGMEIAAHTHPGLQLAVIVEGTLTYTVISGEAEIVRDAGMPQHSAQTLSAGMTADLHPGMAIKEPTGMVHKARNDGSESVVIYLSSLFPEDAPASSPAP